jgi:hydroxylamine reductase
VGVDASRHIPSQDFTPVIDRALELPGFTVFDAAQPKRTHLVGFGHASVLASAGPVLDAISSGALKHIFLVGGCDGNEPQRKYYQRLHAEMPKETLVLTLGCGKFRVLGQEWGTLGDTGLPRLLDMGQCNDAYSALVVAIELAKALKTDVSSLPLSLDISWFEQKAVAVLLTLLALDVKHVRLGPKLPAFLTPEAVALLQEKFALIPADVAKPGNDMKQMMAGV